MHHYNSTQYCNTEKRRHGHATQMRLQYKLSRETFHHSTSAWLQHNDEYTINHCGSALLEITMSGTSPGWWDSLSLIFLYDILMVHYLWTCTFSPAQFERSALSSGVDIFTWVIFFLKKRMMNIFYSHTWNKKFCSFTAAFWDLQMPLQSTYEDNCLKSKKFYTLSINMPSRTNHKPQAT